MMSIKCLSRSTGINQHLTADVLHVVYMIRNMLINTSHTVYNLTHSSLFLIYCFIVAHSESNGIILLHSILIHLCQYVLMARLDFHLSASLCKARM